MAGLVATICGLWLAAAPTWAHPAPGSELVLSVEKQQINADLRIPLSELQAAFRQPIPANGQHEPTQATALLAYLYEHLQVLTPDGRSWFIRLGAIRTDAVHQPAELVVTAEWIPPPGASLRKFTIENDVVSREVPDHTATVSLHSDWQSGTLGEPRVLGTLRYNVHSVSIDLGDGSEWAGLKSSIALGMQHMAEGADHLLFLLVLLLPAPLVVNAARQRWGPYGGARRGIIQLLKIVTGFTIGHSLTLLLGAIDWVRLPAQPVEIVIALSILVSAIHAWRPLVAGKEIYIASGFGLVHGLAFGSVVAGMGLQGAWLVQAILGFNLGIELMQLAIVALVFPLLLAMARTPCYTVVRTAFAALAVLAATAWVAERVSGMPNPLSRPLEALPAYPAYLWLGLLVLTGIIRFVSLARSDAPKAANVTHGKPATQ